MGLRPVSLALLLTGCGIASSDNEWLQFAGCVGTAEAFNDITAERDGQLWDEAAKAIAPARLHVEPIFPGLSSQMATLFDGWASELPPRLQQQMQERRLAVKSDLTASVSYDAYHASIDEPDGGYFGRFAQTCVPLIEDLIAKHGAPTGL